MKKLLFLLTLSVLLSVSAMQAADVLTLGNANFETAWTGLTDYGDPEVILQRVGAIATGVTGWTGDAGNGGLTIYQGPGHTGSNAAVLANPHASGGCRFYNNSVMTLTKGAQYKLTFYARGTATLVNVSLFQSGKRPTIGEVQGPNAGGVYDPSKTANTLINLGSTWTKMEYFYTVPVASAFTDYKLYFAFYTAPTPALDGSNLENVFMIDDITFESYVDNTIATLTEITVGGKAINNFNPNTVTYNILTNNSIIPTVAGTSTDANATVVVSEPVTVGNTITYEIEVTAADGVTKKLYTVIFNVTNDVVLQGFTSDVIPTGWISSQTAGVNDWMIDVNANYNNGLYMGSNSIRIRGGSDPAITSGWLMIPNLDLPDVMTFYLKTRDTGTSTFSVYKRPASEDTFTDFSGWTLCETFEAPYDATFTAKTVSINSNQHTDVLFYVEKENTKIPFGLDDIRITMKDTTTGTTQISASKVIFNTSKGQLYFESPEDINYAVRTLTGVTVKSGQGNHVTLRLPQGFYLVETNGSTQKIIVP
ncbi:MAG: hypothetical protein Q7J05_01505 [Paludibacter sp.]|nr:hypothetical protein [Paludibacter sp.]